MIATLPMYDWPEFRASTDFWWQGVARHAGVQLTLTRDSEFTRPWRSPGLAFSQTCGYPYTHEFRGQFTYVGTPHYAAEGCVGPLYCSFVFAREKQPLAAFKGRTGVINGHDSMSGMLALKVCFAPYAENGAFFAQTMVSGSHRASLRAVQQGKADICAVDSVCVALARRHAPGLLEGLYEVARTPLVPGLPYVTKESQAAKWRDALGRALSDPDLREARENLLIRGLSILPGGAYDVIPALEAHAELTL